MGHDGRVGVLLVLGLWWMADDGRVDVLRHVMLVLKRRLGGLIRRGRG